jgi:hypothetical protein
MMKRLVLSLAFALLAVPAFACTGISSPTVISAPGEYCLTQTLTVMGANDNGVTINADNVSLDLNGHHIQGPGTGTGAGVIASNRSNVTVRDGLVSGFLYGVRLQGGANPKVIGIDASYNLFRGIHATGAGAFVAQNRIKDIKGTAAFPTSHSFAIEISGPNCHARFNVVDEVYPYAGNFEGVAISVNGDGAGCMVYGNTMRWKQKPASGRILGVWAGGNDSLASVHGNVIIGADYGLFRWRATDNGKDNVVTQRCPLFWTTPSTFLTDNDYRFLGGCTDPEAGF